MKRNLINFFFSLLLIFAENIYAQRIILIPHPQGLERRYTGYTGIGMVFNDTLCMQYEWVSFRYQLAIYDGQNVTLIPNPDTVYGHFDGLPGAMAVFKNNLYLQYPNSTGNFQLLKFDGTSLSLIPNPDTVNSSNYLYRGVGEPFQEFNGNLFFPYICADTDRYVAQLARFDDSTICLIPQDTSFRTRIADEAVVYKNELYWQFRQNLADFYLGKLVGDSIILIPNPSAMSDSRATGTIGHSIVYKDNLYWEYWDATGKSQLARCDGNTLTLIENPDGGSLTILFRVIYNDDLYFPYRNAQGTCQLAKFDGSSISLIPNSLIPTTNSITNLIVYKNKIYFIYTINAGSSQLGEYHGERMFLFPNPINSDSTQGGLDRFPVIYNNALFWSYQSKPNYHQLAKFDGNKLILIDNPDSSEQGYLGNPIIYQNDLYLQYLDQNDYLRLARLEDVSGVSVNEKISSFIIYPNPATDQITIDTSLPSDKYHILLFTATGKLILSQSFTGSGIQIDINGLSGGIYIVKLISKEVIGQKKIIKM